MRLGGSAREEWRMLGLVPLFVFVGRNQVLQNRRAGFQENEGNRPGLVF
jgi:hypothetical protein